MRSRPSAEMPLARAERRPAGEQSARHHDRERHASRCKHRASSSRSLDAAAADGEHYIHVSSFRTAEHAAEVARQFTDAGLLASVRPQLVRDVQWHRVYLGPFATHDDAVRLANHLREQGTITYYKVLRLDVKTKARDRSARQHCASPSLWRRCQPAGAEDARGRYRRRLGCSRTRFPPDSVERCRAVPGSHRVRVSQFHDLKRLGFPGQSQVERVLLFLATCRSLETILRESGIEILQTHLPMANFLGLVMSWRGVCRVHPTVHNNREFDYGQNRGALRRYLRRAGYRQMLGHCQGMIAVSEQVKVVHEAQLGLSPAQGEGRIRVVPNGVVVSELPWLQGSAAMRERLGGSVGPRDPDRRRRPADPTEEFRGLGRRSVHACRHGWELAVHHRR